MSKASERLRLLEQDHEPDGWPAVQMRDITELLDELESCRDELRRLLGVIGEAVFYIVTNVLGESDVDIGG